MALFADMEIENQLDFDLIKKRSIKGVFTLTSATIFLQFIALIATFLLTVFLTPAEYGVFFYCFCYC